MMVYGSVYAATRAPVHRTVNGWREGIWGPGPTPVQMKLMLLSGC